MKGIVLKAIGGFFLVQAEEGGNYLCRARGKLKQQRITPMVGDRVIFSTGKATPHQHQAAAEGVIEAVEPRRNCLPRPPVANLEQVILVFSIKEPVPDWQLVNRLLVLAEGAALEGFLCLNKVDLAKPPDLEQVSRLIDFFPYSYLFTSACTGDGVEKLKAQLQGRCSVFAGPSGAGKSSLLNAVQPGLQLKTAPVSNKSRRGRHTTRAAELLPLHDGGMVVDTPGFTRLDLNHLEPDLLPGLFPEFEEKLNHCSFRNCTHISEPDCAVREAVAAGKINALRYQHYQHFFKELSEQEKW